MTEVGSGKEGHQSGSTCTDARADHPPIRCKRGVCFSMILSSGGKAMSGDEGCEMIERREELRRNRERRLVLNSINHPFSRRFWFLLFIFLFFVFFFFFSSSIKNPLNVAAQSLKMVGGVGGRGEEIFPNIFLLPSKTLCEKGERQGWDFDDGGRGSGR